MRALRLLVDLFRAPPPSAPPPPPLPFSEFVEQLQGIQFERLTDTGDPHDLPDYNIPSMFHRRDPILELSRASSQWTLRGGLPRPSGCEEVLLQALAGLVETDPPVQEVVPLAALSGLSAAKDSDFGTLEEFGNQLKRREEYRGASWSYYGFETEADFQKTWGDVLRAHGPVPSVYVREWDRRWFFRNHGTAHRLAAAHRQDREQQRATVFPARVTRQRIEGSAARVVLATAIGILLYGDTFNEVAGLVHTAGLRPFFYRDAWRTRLRDVQVLWLPAQEPAACAMAYHILRAAPPMHAYDVTAFLHTALLSQEGRE